MKATQEMMHAFVSAVWTDAHGHTELTRSEIKAGITAVLDLIEKQQAAMGVQADRDGELEMQCLAAGDSFGGCAWHRDIRQSSDDWTTVADLDRIAREHFEEDHR